MNNVIYLKQRTLRRCFQARYFHRVCIIGGGASGFYAAKYLLDKKIVGMDVKVDMVDKLPIPFGLIRYGVAPDHPEVKSVTDQFIEVVKSYFMLLIITFLGCKES